jgi:hypothetical protein
VVTGRPILASSPRQHGITVNELTLILPSPEDMLKVHLICIVVEVTRLQELGRSMVPVISKTQNRGLSCLPGMLFQSGLRLAGQTVEGLESARSVLGIGSGRKLTFCADGRVRPSCGDTFSLPRCQRVLAACTLGQFSEIQRGGPWISKVERKQ